MTQDILIRELTTEDYNEYLPLICEFRETNFTEDEFQQFVQSLGPHIHIYILLLNNELIATTTVIYEPKLIFNRCTFAHIEDVCVLKSHQKGGWGSTLIQHVIQEAKKKGCYKATLVCNEMTSPFYLKNGFERRGVQCSMLL
jgi:GNAT superfamily N-acetyltransferase